MTLTRWQGKKVWDPFGDLMDLHNEISRVLDFPMQARGEGATTNAGMMFPPVDVVMEKDNVLVRAEVPGMTKDNLDISLNGDILTIKGEKHQEKESKEKNIYRSERVYGSFQRSFVLPSAVNAEKISAAYNNGVLEITLPKKEEEKGKQIQISVK